MDLSRLVADFRSALKLVKNTSEGEVMRYSRGGTPSKFLVCRNLGREYILVASSRDARYLEQVLEHLSPKGFSISLGRDVATPKGHYFGVEILQI